MCQDGNLQVQEFLVKFNLLLVLMLFFLVPASTSTIAQVRFQDISLHFAKRFIAKVPENGVSKNVETFRPE